MNTDHRPGSSGTGRSPRRWRAVALVAIGIAVGVAMTATPVVGHITGSVAHLWNAHIKPKTDARYYTKAQANTRFLGADGKAADADQLDGLDSAAFLRSDGKAADAETLDGLDSAAFLRSDGKAADADKLDGLDSTQIVQGNGQAIGAARALPRINTGFVVFLTVPGAVALGYECLVGGGDGTLLILHRSPQAMNLFVESGQANPTYIDFPVDGFRFFSAAAAGDSFHIQAQGSFGVLTIEVATVNRASDCHVQAQAVLTR
jgi:hypothetical protein